MFLARTACSSVNMELANDKEKSKSSVQVGPEYCTPKPVMPSQKEAIDSKKKQTAKKIASIIKNSSAVKPKNQLQSAQAKRLIFSLNSVYIDVCSFGFLQIY